MAELHKIRIDAISEERYKQQLWDDLCGSVDTYGPEAQYLMEKLGPTLVQCLQDLTIAYEKEEQKCLRHRKLMHKNPAILPRPVFNPLHWLASHLMQRNPNFSGEPVQLNPNYSFAKAANPASAPSPVRASSAASDMTEYDVQFRVHTSGQIGVSLEGLPKAARNSENERGSST